jgi:hypothetical protein
MASFVVVLEALSLRRVHHFPEFGEAKPRGTPRITAHRGRSGEGMVPEGVAGTPFHTDLMPDQVAPLERQISAD